MKKIFWVLLLVGIFGIFRSIQFNDKDNKLLNSSELGVFMNNVRQDDFPKKGEAIFDEAVCDDENIEVMWDNKSWGLLLKKLTKKVKCNLYFYQGDTVFNFDYIGDVQSFTAPIKGTYKIEAWGASGGDVTINDVTYQGGLGGYTSGTINLEKNQTLYIYVGSSPSNYEGGYNGGAKGGSGTDGKYTGGGGATDIRIINGNWNDFNSLKSRIMVAAGGAGTGYYGSEIIGGAGGGLNGYQGTLKSGGVIDKNHIIATAGNQISGGIGCQGCSTRTGTSGNGFFGYSVFTGYDYGTGGGSGYNGGGSGGATANNVSSGAGGSSFISGHNGCDAIKKESTEDNIIHTGESIHYSGLYFTNTVMIDGNGYNWTTEKGDYLKMPSHVDNTTMTGNHGNGFARITMIFNDN